MTTLALAHHCALSVTETVEYIASLDKMKTRLGARGAWAQLIAETNAVVYERRVSPGFNVGGLEQEGAHMSSRERANTEHQVAALVPTDFSSQADYSTYYLALPDDYTHVSTISTVEEAEMEAALALVPRGEATKLFAVASGDWNTPGNWYPYGIPGPGAKVVIGENSICTYNRDDAVTPIFSIRVDGNFYTDSGGDTALLFETMVVTPSGFFRDGTVHAPVDGDKSHEWIIDTTGGPIDVTWDKLFQSRGIISLGEVSIYGARKTPFLEAATHSAPAEYAKRLTLASPPDNWQVGDEVVICSTRCQGRSWFGSWSGHLNAQDERRTLTSVSGATIGWAGRLSHDHRGFAATATRPELKCYVMNLTRNVKFRPSDASVPPTQRGHLMQMHNPAGWSMRHAEIADLGRTAKLGWYLGRVVNAIGGIAAGISLPLNESPYWNAGRSAIYTGYTFLLSYAIPASSGDGVCTITGTDENGAPQTEEFKYPAGGIQTPRTSKYFLEISEIKCSTAFASALPFFWIEATSRQLNERGVRNLQGTGEPVYTDVKPTVNIQGRYPFHWHKLGVLGGILENPPILDGCAFHGSPGWLVAQHQTHGIIKNCVGFGAQGAGLVAEDANETGLWFNCLMAGFPGNGDESHKSQYDQLNRDPARSGTAYWFTGRGMRVSHTVAVSALAGHAYNARLANVAMLPEQMDQPTALRANPTLEIEDDPIDHFADNTDIACTLGLIVVKANPNQNHDVRTPLKRHLMWSCTIGCEITYTQHYSIIDFNFFGGYVDANLGVSGGRSAQGIVVGTNTTDIVFVNPVIEKAERGLLLYHSNNGSTKHGVFNKPPDDAVTILSPRAGHVVVNTTFIDVGAEYYGHDLGPVSVDKFLDNRDLGTDDVTLLNAVVTQQSATNWRVTATRIDALGVFPYPSGQEDYEYGIFGSYSIASMLAKYGYYVDVTDAKKYLMTDEWFSSRYSGDLKKIRLPVDVSALDLGGYAKNGAIDLSNKLGPVLSDFTVTISRNTPLGIGAVGLAIDVVGRASHPLGVPMKFGGKRSGMMTEIIENGDGTITLVPLVDEIYSEDCHVWVDDLNGNTTRAVMTVRVTETAQMPRGAL